MLSICHFAGSSFFRSVEFYHHNRDYIRRPGGHKSSLTVTGLGYRGQCELVIARTSLNCFAYVCRFAHVICFNELSGMVNFKFKFVHKFRKLKELAFKQTTLCLRGGRSKALLGYHGFSEKSLFNYVHGTTLETSNKIVICLLFSHFGKLDRTR